MPKIAIDVMGGDYGPCITLKSIWNLLQEKSELTVHLYGHIDYIKPWFDSLSDKTKESVIIHHCEEVIDNHTPPKEAIRKYKNSSMRQAIESLTAGLCDIAVSAGNTGALAALGKVVLETQEGISRPAIAKYLPSFEENSPYTSSLMLDLGINLDCTPEQLIEFSQLGDALVKDLYPAIQKPEIRLLNIGTESIKGNTLVKQTADLLQQESSRLNFAGFIEPHDLYCGLCNIIICDGFSGNIALKTSEGVAKVLINKVKKAFAANILSNIGGLLARNSLKSELSSVDPNKHNGAFIVGLKKLLVKSHGNANSEGFYQALCFAYQAIIQKKV